MDYELDEGEDSSKWPDKQSADTKAETRRVGTKQPNPRSLYDMLGNVREWTQDHWHDDDHGSRSDGASWVDANHVARGGS